MPEPPEAQAIRLSDAAAEAIRLFWRCASINMHLVGASTTKGLPMLDIDANGTYLRS